MSLLLAKIVFLRLNEFSFNIKFAYEISEMKHIRVKCFHTDMQIRYQLVMK